MAQQSGVPPSTLRFYEERGLISAIGRRGLRRQYAPAVLDRLALIALGRTAGFSLDDIARMFGPDGTPHIDRNLLSSKARELDESIRKLSALRDGLRHAAACSAPSHMECPTFRRLLGLATAVEARKRRRAKLQGRSAAARASHPKPGGNRKRTTY